jgi:hypothetical protein
MGNTDTINIRKASSSDIEPMVKMHMGAFTPEHHPPVALGEDYIRAFFRWIVTSSETYALVAEENSQVIGYITVCDHYSYMSKMFIACLPEFIKSIVKKPSLLWNQYLWKRFLRHNKQHDERAKMISTYPGISRVMVGAVDVNARGKGVYGKLYHATREFSKNRGSRALRGDCYKGNISVRKVKERDNWVEIHELETNETVAYMAFLDEAIIAELSLSPKIEYDTVKQSIS